MSYRQSWGEAFSRPYREIASARGSQARAAQTEERTKEMPDLLSLKRQRLQGQLDMLRARINQMGINSRLRERQMSNLDLFRNAQLAEKKREFDLLQKNGGMGGARTNQGRLISIDLPEGQGQFQTPTIKSLSALQQAQNSIYPLAESMDQIKSGVANAVSAGGNLNKILASAVAYGTGKATKSQEKILENYRISKNAITQAAESMLRVMQLNGTEHNLNSIMEIFTPKKGETVNSFFSGLNQTFNDMKRRAVIADYIGQFGAPLNDAAKENMKNYIDKEMSSNLYGSSFENSKNANQNLNNVVDEAVSSSKLPSGVTDEDVDMVMKKYPDLSRPQAIKFIANLHQEVNS